MPADQLVALRQVHYVTSNMKIRGIEQQ